MPETEGKPILLLVDGHSLAFRSFYAFAKGGEGGLENIRDPELHKREHMKLMEKYPDFVYIHNENMKPWGKHGKKLDFTFVEFRYKLKDAYESSKTIKHDFF